nr:DUF1801 domain-containing protein [uncultured Flavobacterium sp.]
MENEGPKNNLNVEVTKFLDNLNLPLRKEIEQLRFIISDTDKIVTENIKWNGPNYCFNNEDRITIRVQQPKMVQIIFHRGAKVQTQPVKKLIADESGVLEWKGNDRAVATFKNSNEIEANKLILTKIIANWLDATA